MPGREFNPADASVSFRRLHYGKLANGDDLAVPASEGYRVTRLAAGVDPDMVAALSPGRLLGVRRLYPEIVDEGARPLGCLVGRAGPGDSFVLARLRFRPEDGEGGHGRLHQQSAVWMTDFDDWRRHPAACIFIAGRTLRAAPDVRDEPEQSRLGEAPRRWRFRRPDPARVREMLEHSRGGSAMLTFLADAAETNGDARIDFGPTDFEVEKDFLFVVGLALQYLPLSYPRWRDIAILSGFGGAIPGICLRYAPAAANVGTAASDSGRNARAA
jgi:hypothetical protein